ncbi:MAG: purine-nucleoside phosphorylase [Rhodothermales bacterium]
MENSISDIGEALQFVRQFDTRKPKLGLILGSGLGAVAELVTDAVEISTGSIPGYPESTVAGHSGSLVIGELAGVLVAIVRGRVHCYEGHSVRAVAFPVRLLHGLGVRRLIVTNAAGGANPDLSPGSIMFIEDHINSVGKNPLVGPNLDHGPRFPDMSEPYDLDWISEAESIAGAEGIRVHRGVYLWTLGPSYETKAEVRAFARLGADAIGMSTVPEVIQAVYLGMKVLGISTITNRAAGLGDDRLSHEDVLEVGRRVGADLKRLVSGIVRRT